MTTYNLNDVYVSVQGEGVMTGVPMVIVRLHGCPVGCAFCDTKETWRTSQETKVATLEEALGANERWCEVSAEDLAAYCRTMTNLDWILLTGGEPAEQLLGPLVAAFHEQEFYVAIETSGTAVGHLDTMVDWITVSPKIGMPGLRAIQEDAITSADEIKHVVGRLEDIDKLDAMLGLYEPKEGSTVCLQPLSGSAAATKLCIAVCLERGWRLSIQTHKLVGLR